MTPTREFSTEEPNRSGCIVTVPSPGQLGFVVTCDDDFYGFADVKTVSLGQFLCELGLTAADCERAIAEWLHKEMVSRNAATPTDAQLNAFTGRGCQPTKLSSAK